MLYNFFSEENLDEIKSKFTYNIWNDSPLENTLGNKLNDYSKFRILDYTVI